MTRRHILFGAFVALALFTLGCPKHDDFPAALDLDAPPTPETFTATYEGFDTDDGEHLYTFSWTIDDPTDVAAYRIYIYDTPSPRLVGTVTNATSFPTSFPFTITGLQMGVSAVSTANIEGEQRILIVPAPE